MHIDGAVGVHMEPKHDERGFFGRVHCEEEFTAAGLVSRFVQTSVSFNLHRGTVRGMHYSVPPYDETKLVRCTAGEVHDVIVDLRPNSPTFRRSTSIRLSAKNRVALYVPSGVAHGFQTLEDETEVLYMIDKPYVPVSARGLRWNDPSFDIRWPEPISSIAKRDERYSDWSL